jgi:transcription initiation factor IIE alpha subunit
MSNLGHAMDLTVTCPECGSEFIEMLDDEGFLQADDDEDDYLSEGGDE